MIHDVIEQAAISSEIIGIVSSARAKDSLNPFFLPSRSHGTDSKFQAIKTLNKPNAVSFMKLAFLHHLPKLI